VEAPERSGVTVFDLGDGKQVVLGHGRIQLWVNRGCLGVELTPDQEKEIGLAMWQSGRRRSERK
jgi:hypothetical protein